MAAFNVSEIDLTAYGYPPTVSFIDPMTPQFQAATWTGTDLDQIKNVVLPGFVGLHAYPDALKYESDLDDYYNKASTTSSAATCTKTSGGGSGKQCP